MFHAARGLLPMIVRTTHSTPASIVCKAADRSGASGDFVLSGESKERDEVKGSHLGSGLAQ